MLTGRLYIDGNDVYAQYGVYVVKDGWNEVIAYPPLKAVTSNDWQEMDGVEADLSNPVLNTREVQLKIAYDGLYGRFFTLIELLSDGAYHTFEAASIGRTFRLRLASVPNLKEAQNLGTVTLKLADDFPLRNYAYRAPQSSIAPYEDYTFDGVPFTNYGARVLKGTLAEVIKPAAVKPNLLRNIASLSGAMYDGANVFYKAKDVKVFFLMRADTLEQLWRNYDALLYDLIRPEERSLYVESLGQAFPCYYKSCQVTKFYPSGKIWLQFTLTFTFTRDFRIGDNDIVLAAENGVIIFTEDNLYAIDMKPARLDRATVCFVNNRQTLRLTGNGSFRFNNK